MTATEQPIYLDHAATTPMAPEVLDAMLPWLSGTKGFGNPSSVHAYGRLARNAIDSARDDVAQLIGADYGEITFTSSGTEADNLALIGAMTAGSIRNHIIVTAVEHHAVLNAAHYLQERGFRLTVLPVQPDGLISLDALDNAICADTCLVSVMHANNEIGVIQPIQAAAALAHAKNALFHTDAVQTVGLLNVDVKVLDCDMLSLSAHKFYGPKGTGALYVRQGVKLSPMLHGGGQERERRAGTESVAGIVGLGAAATIARQHVAEGNGAIEQLRDRFISLLYQQIEGVTLNGSATERLPGNINISFDGIEGSTMLMNLDRHGIYASSGAACSSGSIEPSHVLTAIGLTSSAASAGIRFSLGRGTTWDELERTVDAIQQICVRLRRR